MSYVTSSQLEEYDIIDGTPRKLITKRELLRSLLHVYDVTIVNYDKKLHSQLHNHCADSRARSDIENLCATNCFSRLEAEKKLNVLTKIEFFFLFFFASRPPFPPRNENRCAD